MFVLICEILVYAYLDITVAEFHPAFNQLKFVSMIPKAQSSWQPLGT